MKVIGVGDADVDIYLDVDHIPGRDEKVVARAVSFYPGGMVANFLVALAQLGTPCAFHGSVGDDEFGRLSLAQMADSGVDISCAIVRPGERTYFCIVMLDESGEKALVVAPTSCLFPRLEHISEECIARAQHLHTTAADVRTTVRIVQIAKQHGLTVSVDVEVGAVLQGRGLSSLLSLVDVMFVNHRAVDLLCRSDSLADWATRMIAKGTRVVCITKGDQGALVVSGSETVDIGAFAVPVKDTTGAGDCFAAGFIHGWLRQWPLSKVAIFANAVGAISVTRRGGRSNPPTISEVTAFLKERGVDLNIM